MPEGILQKIIMAAISTHGGDSATDIYNDLTLFITPDKFFIQPSTGHEILIVDRLNEEIRIERSKGQIPTANTRKNFCGFLGTIQLIAGRYLVIATQRDYVGTIAGHHIWRLVKAELIPYFKSTLHLNNYQVSDNNIHVSMIESVLATPFLYFSYTYDLTHTLQRLHHISPKFWTTSLPERADQRFLWNHHLLKGVSHLTHFSLPLIHGFISINNCTVNGNNFSWILVSRRSVQRSGTRLFRRGVDRFGHVANFVETEQIIEYQGDRASYVQVRGSIPLYWTQDPDLRYKPPPTLAEIDPHEQITACRKHFESHSLLYGRQVCIDLVDQHGAEGRLEKAFKEAVENLSLSFVRYEPFDFHQECRKMRWDRLSILIDRVAFEQDDMSFFLMLRDGSLSSLQEGVFRTNCVDCLDRTNVVQSLLAHRNLEIVLRKMNILQQNQSLHLQHSFEFLYKNVWADNADVISTQYSGTGALKTDFTRTGKRTKAGLLQDGINSLLRYYKNNFTDGYRQDAIDLFLGYCSPTSPYVLVRRDWRYITFPSILLVALSMFVASVIFPAEYNTESLLYLLFWGSMVAATTTAIFRYGTEFVDRPRLTYLNPQYQI